MTLVRTLPAPIVTLAVALLLALHWWLGVSATREMCSTADELVHVTGGLAYWKFDDYRFHPENGNLPQRIAALPWLFADAQFAPTLAPEAWPKSNAWIVGHRLFYGSGNNTDYLLFLSRATMGLIGVALGVLIFAWSRRLWGDRGAVLSLAFYAFCPNFLAHAPLATSDVTATLCLLAASGALWWQSRTLGAGSLALSLTMTALACVAKFSFGLLLPIYILLIVVRVASAEPLVVEFGRPRMFSKWHQKLALLLGSGAAHVAFAWIAIWAAFGFRFSAIGAGMPPQSQFFAPWELVMPERGFWRFFFSAAREWHLLPEAFLQGFAYVLYASAERGAFLNGEYSNTGWRHFFPYTFLVKTPPPQLLAYGLMLGLGAISLRGAGKFIEKLRQLGRRAYRITPLLALFFVYWGVSIASHLNIGHRHILPTYPVLFIGLGALMHVRFGHAIAVAGCALAAWQVGTSFAIRPHYLAYFNAFAGGPANGWRHLVDSSLDWGQDLPRVASWVHRNARPREQIYVSYFGSGDFEYEGIKARELAPIYNFDKPRSWFELGPGIYCIGATMLQDVYSGWRGPWTLEKEKNYLALRRRLADAPQPKNKDELAVRAAELYELDRLRFARLCEYLKIRRPDAAIGYSQFIYRLTAEEVRAAAYGTMSELAALIERVTETRAPAH